MTWVPELRELAPRAAFQDALPEELPRCRVRGNLALSHRPALCSRFRGQPEAPAPKVEKVRKSLKRFILFGCKSESNLTFSSSSSSSFSVDSDREDGNYCPPVKRERTSSLTQFPPSQSGNRCRPFPGGESVRAPL